MLNNLPFFSFFQRNSGYAALFIRLAFGIQLIYFTQDNVFSYDRMLEFRDFLQKLHFPFPLFCAFLSVIAQFTCGILLIIGAFVRPVGLVITINFIVALIGVHTNDAYPQFYPAANLLAAGLFFLFNGAGKLSVDEWLKRGARP